MDPNLQNSNIQPSPSSNTHKTWKIFAIIAVVVAIVFLVSFISNKQKLSAIKSDFTAFQQTLSELSPEMSAIVLNSITTSKIPTNPGPNIFYTIVYYNDGSCVVVFDNGTTSTGQATLQGGLGCAVAGGIFHRIGNNPDIIIDNISSQYSIIGSLSKNDSSLLSTLLKKKSNSTIGTGIGKAIKDKSGYQSLKIVTNPTNLPVVLFVIHHYPDGSCSVDIGSESLGGGTSIAGEGNVMLCQIGHQIFAPFIDLDFSDNEITKPLLKK